MNLFEDIQGKFGENLSSAALRHLLLRSSVCRENMISIISKASPVGPVRVRNCFSILLEVQTESPGDESEEESVTGRLDLVIETDDAVIGIENKFNAQFQPGQPSKYVAGLQKRAEALKPLREQAEVRPCLIVLGPKSRKSEVDKVIHSQEIERSAAFLAWEDLLQALSEGEISDPVDRYLLQELREYVNNQIGFPSDIRDILPHLRTPFEGHGSQLQRQMVSSLWNIFDASLYADSHSWGASRNSHCGYFMKPSPESPSLWYGFVSGAEFGSQTKFVLSVKSPDEELEGDHLRKITSSPAIWEGWSIWEVEFGDDWVEQAQWEKAVLPFNQRFRNEDGV